MKQSEGEQAEIIKRNLGDLLCVVGFVFQENEKAIFIKKLFLLPKTCRKYYNFEDGRYFNYRND